MSVARSCLPATGTPPCSLPPAASAVLQTAKDVVAKVVQELGRVDVLVNNASVQHYCDDITNITPEQLDETFTTNVFGYFYFAQVSHRPLLTTVKLLA
jgi:NAD(P)-dependent dehydrogenase (short-subunit alcohol dehydrogenase family)